MYENLIVKAKKTPKAQDLNDLGLESWELVTVIMDKKDFILFFKRPIRNRAT